MSLYAKVEGTNKELAMTLIRNCGVFVLCRIIKLNATANKSVHRRKNGHVDHHHEYKEKDKSIFGEIICQLHHNSPDNCEMNELKDFND
jgi:hypothetical protein